MTGIIDYGAGNTASVSYALDILNAKYTLTNDVSILQKCDRIIFPGVGAAKHAMNIIIAAKIDTFLRATKLPVLGICLGMQLLSVYSEEGDIQCLGIIPQTCMRFSTEDAKIPHMGWTKTVMLSPSLLFDGINKTEYFYYAHSFYLPLSEYSLSKADNVIPFSASIQTQNFYGVQFHPEKSSAAGLRVLKNFIELT